MSKRKVRFNLGRGKNYLKWKVEIPNESNKSNTFYYDPNLYQLVMTGCILKNNKKTSEKIFNGSNKSVCAWILCDMVEIKKIDHKIILPSNLTQIRYNPRIQPNWIINDSNADNLEIDMIVSDGKKLFSIPQ